MPNTFEIFATDYDEAINKCIAFFIGKESLSNVAKLIRQLPAKTGGNGLYSLALLSKLALLFLGLLPEMYSDLNSGTG